MPIFHFHNTRWSLTPNLATDIERVQMKMIASLAKYRRSLAETPEGLVGRRARETGNTTAQQGLWNIRTAKRICACQEHLHRPANARRWAAKLLQHKGREWLQARRAARDSPSLQAGRTGTRLQAGKVQTRWHDGAEYAKLYVRCQATASRPATPNRMRADLEQTIGRSRTNCI